MQPHVLAVNYRTAIREDCTTIAGEPPSRLRHVELHKKTKHTPCACIRNHRYAGSWLDEQTQAVKELHPPLSLSLEEHGCGLIATWSQQPSPNCRPIVGTHFLPLMQK